MDWFRMALGAIAAGATFFGIAVFLGADSAIHEIEGLISLLIGMVLAGSFLIASLLDQGLQILVSLVQLETTKIEMQMSNVETPDTRLS